ncbi:Uncharacterized protein PRO82_002293 [Candidatus Protochlamydia amoebophila]|uniref:CHAT domain-containing protein n=1 Tax=Candidatus Protochlamydia amoebophila TaxID=362787 RepID=UPI001BC983FD|nr:CHAT domain-containing protein [Candidatus Protochlamydia amoebophila]MBS4164951.1 Uncharacterized protein [Candidatus Protochlamydia amoebophila]
MNVGSVKYNTLYQLLYPQTSHISTLDHVKGLIEAYETKFVTEENIINSAKWLLEEINQLEDISIKRECLCRLLKIEREEIQNLIVEEVTPLFDIRTFLYDIQHDQAQQLVHLEEITSEIIASKLSLDELNFLFPICMIYQDILEHLWLLPYFESSNYCSNLLAQNKNFILSHMERWKGGLDQLANEEKIESFIPKNLEKSVLRLFQRLPETVAKDIDRQKSVINKSKRITSDFLAIMAKIYSDEKDFYRAIICAETLLKILRKKLPEILQNKNLLISIMQINEQLSILNQLLGQYERTIFYKTEALKIARESSDIYKEFIYSKDLAFLYFKQGQGELALSFFTEARSATQTLKDSKSESQILVNLAEAYLSLNKNLDAIRCYQDALNLTENQSEKALIYTQIGRAQAHAQRYQSAKETYQKALKFLPQDDLLLAIKIHGDLTAFFHDWGRYEAAIFHAEKTLELTKHPSVQLDTLEVLDSKFQGLTAIGNLYGTIGDYETEIDHLTQALKIAKKLDPSFLGILEIAYSNLGSAYSHVKKYSESIEYYIKALKIAKEPLIRAKILANLGNIFYKCGMYPKAIQQYEKANEISGSPIVKASRLNGLALCYAAIGNEKKAIRTFKNFICLSQQSENRRGEGAGYQNLGKLYRKSDAKLAEENFRKSIDVYALLHRELKNHSQWQITFFEEQAISLLSLESLLLEQAKNEEALQLADFRRSRALVSTLTKKFQFQKNDSLSSGITAREMQAFAHKMNTCFILYSFSFENRDNIIVWVIPSQGGIICQQLSLGNLAEEVKETTYVFQMFPFIVEPTVAKRRPFLRQQRTRSSLTYTFLDELTRGDPDKSANPAVLQSFKERLFLWYEALIAPLESYLPKDPQQVVTIIPDGFLAQIPFAAFLDKEGNYLIEKHPISIAPSIGILKLLDEIPKNFSENSLVIGNPTALHLKDKLPLAEKEAQTIVAPLLKTTPEKILLQDSATAQCVLEGMRDARWVHLACHGSTGTKPEKKLDSHSVFEGLFKLAPEQENHNGYLHAQEIASLTLRTELVFMSACFSGRGKLHREGSVGPVWSFLAAGALSTIATYWRLPDSDLTLQMVDTFYRHLLGIEVEKLNKAQALQKAMLMAIRQEREQPHLWGAFFLSGLHE